MRVRVSSREGYKHPSYVLRLSQRRREGRKAGRLPALLSSDLPRWARYLGVTCSEYLQNPIVLVLDVLVVYQADLSLISGKVILKHWACGAHRST